MAAFYCTGLLLRESGVRISLERRSEQAFTFDSWCAHRFYRGRRKCWLFVHPQTFFSFFIESSPRQTLNEIIPSFSKCLSEVLFYADFSAEEIHYVASLAQGPPSFRVLKERITQRHVGLLAGQYRWFAEKADKKSELEGVMISIQINEIPLESLDFETPADVFKRQVSEAFEEEQKAA